MEINYQETSNDLLTRIRIHETYGARNIDQWNTEVLQPTGDMKILDVGCGAGKQCFLYSDDTNRQADITGTDFSEELLAKAREKLAERGDKNVRFAFMDFNKRNKENQDFWSKSKTESQFTPGGSTSTESPVIKYLKEIANNTKTTVGGGSRSANAYNTGDVQRALYKALNAQVV
jgi:SAM-dependent methyltransferase